MKLKLCAKVLSLPTTQIEIDRIISQWEAVPISSIYLLSSDTENSFFFRIQKKFSDKIHLIVQTLLADNKSSFPLAICADGTFAIGEEDGSWLKMFCPNGINSDGVTIAEWRSIQIRKLIREFNPVGISLDFIRHFIFWEGVKENDSLDQSKQSCFCLRCRNEFEEFSSIQLPILAENTVTTSSWILENHPKEWELFTRNSISVLAKELTRVAKEEKPSIEISIHVVPWKKEEFNTGRRRVIGQDLHELKNLTNNISPMCYAPMLQRPTSWINDIVVDMSAETNTSILPAVQICPMYGSTPLSNKEFSTMITAAIQVPAAGVIIWPWERITDTQFDLLSHINFD